MKRCARQLVTRRHFSAGAPEEARPARNIVIAGLTTLFLGAAAYASGEGEAGVTAAAPHVHTRPPLEEQEREEAEGQVGAEERQQVDRLVEKMLAREAAQEAAHAREEEEEEEARKAAREASRAQREALEREVEELRLELRAASEAAREFDAELARVRKEADRRVRLEQAIVRQDLEEEQLEAIEARLEVERAAMELRRVAAVEEERERIAEEAKMLMQERVAEVYEGVGQETRKRVKSWSAAEQKMQKLHEEFNNFGISQVQLLGTLRVANAVADLARACDAMGPTERSSIRAQVKAARDAAQSGDEVALELLAALPEEAVEQGVPRLSFIEARFEALAREVRELEVVPKDQGMLWYAVGKVVSKVLVPRAPSLDEGDSYDAAMSRAAFKLATGDLPGAIEEVELLELEKECGEWLRVAKQRVRVLHVVAALTAHSKARANSLESALRASEKVLDDKQ